MRNRHCRWWLGWSLIVPIIFCFCAPWLLVVGLLMAGLSLQWRRDDKSTSFHVVAGFVVAASGSLPLLLTSSMPGGIMGYFAFNASLALVSVGMTYETENQTTQSTEPYPGNYDDDTTVECEIWQNGQWVPMERFK